jgi:hypothetical protein
MDDQRENTRVTRPADVEERSLGHAALDAAIALGTVAGVAEIGLLTNEVHQAVKGKLTGPKDDAPKDAPPAD